MTTVEGNNVAYHNSTAAYAKKRALLVLLRFSMRNLRIHKEKIIVCHL